MNTERFRFCPQDGAALLRLGAGSAWRCPECGREYYPAPHPTASVLITRRGGAEVLMTRRLEEPFAGQWDVPGGFLEPGESFEDGLRREVREELGAELTNFEYLGSYPDAYGSANDATINVFFRAEADLNEWKVGSDVGEARWFELRDAIPAAAFENGRWALRLWKSRLAALPAE